MHDLCNVCGREHAVLRTDYGSNEPGPWLALTPQERLTRGVLGPDNCIIDGEQFFLRGCVFVPIQSRDETFVWGLWAGLTRGNYQRIVDIWDDPHRDEEPDFAARLANALPLSIYPSTMNLLCRLQLRSPGLRPAITVVSDHPLREDQRSGITVQRVLELEHLLMPA
jgi:hypothetical protein